MGVKVREKVKGSGEWWLFITHDGKRTSKKVGKDRKKAQEAAELIKAKIALGDFNLKKNETEQVPLFEEYTKIWIESYIKPLRRESTYERYSQALDHVLPTIGKKPMDEIKRSDIRDLLLSLHNKGLSRASIALARDVISGAFNHAIDDELLQVNPSSGILRRLKLDRDKRSAINPLTPSEVANFLSTCRKISADFFPLFLCCFRTGMRIGEILSLKWSDVDWTGKYIVVQRSTRRGKINKTKTEKIRRVDMSDQLAETLRQLLTQRKRETLQNGAGELAEYVFIRNGKPIPKNTVTNHYNKILQKAGIRKVRVHDMRHTFASILLTNNESLVYVKEQMGHSSIKMTVDIYGHLIPSSNRAAVNRLDDEHPAAPHLHPAKANRP
ncbi:MAG: hypothetical protein VR64_21285 [Desulfatitalea sp. BRH_c12]|nr:MAG: hypothetical protein VR64_21285 [Desulfatitalea sp. BRH_c12]